MGYLRRSALVRLLVIAACAIFADGCGYRKIRAHNDADPSNVAILRTQHEELGEQLTVAMLDGIPVSFAPFSGQEFEISCGLHILQVHYKGGSWHSRNPATLMFEARRGGRYEVQGTRIKEGFSTEFIRAAAAYAESSWTSWIVDLDSNEVVAGARVGFAHFETDLEHIDRSNDPFSITAEEVPP